MKLHAMKEIEAHKLANKKSRPKAVLSAKREMTVLSAKIDEEPLNSSQREYASPSKQRGTTHGPRDRASHGKREIDEERDSGGRTPTPPPRPRGGRQALYDSWFPSSPRTNHGGFIFSAWL